MTKQIHPNLLFKECKMQFMFTKNNIPIMHQIIYKSPYIPETFPKKDSIVEINHKLYTVINYQITITNQNTLLIVYTLKNID